jgi:hypothetical protein
MFVHSLSQPDPRCLGLRLIQSQKARAVASATPERKLGSELVVAGGDPTEVLQAAEGVFDEV